MDFETRQQTWEEALKEAEEYRKAAVGGMDRTAVFTPRILYNILAMSAEKYCIALFTSRRYMTEGHTFHDLAAALVEVLGSDIDEGFLKEFKDLDKPQMEQCSLALYKPTPMGYEDISSYLGVLEGLRELITGHLPRTAA